MKFGVVHLLALISLAGCHSGEVESASIFQGRSETSLSFGHPKADCAECHEGYVDEWEMSSHAYAAKDPIFHAMVRAGQAQSQGKVGQFCVQCHSPVGLATGQTEVFFDEDEEVFKQNTEDLDEIAAAGVSCDVCHSITEVIEPKNARMVFTPDGVKRATIKNPMPTEAHESSYSELHASSDLCGSCHTVTTPRGALAEETYEEWTQSRAARQGQTCQDCHMPDYTGQAAPGAPIRTLHRHTFVGVDVSLLPPDEFPGYDKGRTLAAQMLRSSADLGVRVVPAERIIEVATTNLSGHALPSGATAERQLWLEAIVENEDGQVVFESGTLDSHGDIRDAIASHSSIPGTDPQLAYYGQYLIEDQELKRLTEPRLVEQRKRVLDAACDAIVGGRDDAPSGVKVVTFPWQANWQCNRMIRPDATAKHVFDMGDLEAGKYTVRVRLLFRTFPPYFLRKLEAIAALDSEVKERVPLVTIAERTLLFHINEGASGEAPSRED